MKLRISRVKLKNFKAFEEITIKNNHDFNIIIGENSVGKSTIFEALHLWEKCYQTYIQTSRKGFYKTSGSRYVNYQELDFLRITGDNDLFFNPKSGAEITVSLTNHDDEVTWDLGFKVSKPTSIENAFYRVQIIDNDQFFSFASEFCKNNGEFLDEAVFIYQTRPVSGVHQFEPYFNEAQIKKRIQKGLSHEVLRNKIISKRDSIVELAKSISEILEKNVEFRLPEKGKEKKDEYINLTVSINGSGFYDLHLQGSGFLQITEILATIEFIDAPLKLLLVDEPDSHIHSKLQQNLITHLRNIEHNQFFVISHNDQFVSCAGENEVFYLCDEYKRTKELSPLPSKSFDEIKKALGGVILSLENLNKAKNIVFVEGHDDACYLERLAKKVAYVKGGERNISEFKFFPLRGKDNILNKIEYNKRTLSELFSGKRWVVIFDRDFSTEAVNRELKECMERKMGVDSLAISHDGYCIESVVFSNIDILRRILNGFVCDEVKVDSFLCEFVQSIEEDLSNVSSDLYQSLKLSFNGQKRNRPEIGEIDFDDFVKDCLVGGIKIQRLMNKDLIMKFVLDLEDSIKRSLFLRSSNDKDEICSVFLLKYIEAISCNEDIFPSFLDLLSSTNLIFNKGFSPNGYESEFSGDISESRASVCPL